MPRSLKKRRVSVHEGAGDVLYLSKFQVPAWLVFLRLVVVRATVVQRIPCSEARWFERRGTVQKQMTPSSVSCGIDNRTGAARRCVVAEFKKITASDDDALDSVLCVFASQPILILG